MLVPEPAATHRLPLYETSFPAVENTSKPMGVKYLPPFKLYEIADVPLPTETKFATVDAGTATMDAVTFAAYRAKHRLPT
jgi:hypothetical protein